MKNRLVLIAFILFSIARGPLAASEAIWEVHVAAVLPASDFVIPDPLPQPVLFLPLAATVPDVSLSQPAAPLRLPAMRPPAGSGKALFDANLAVMIGLNLADYISTREALKYPGLEETNPLMKPFVKNPAVFAAFKIGTTALSYWSMKVIFKKNKTVAWVMATASNVFLSYVVANNLRQIQAARVR
jgi:hypothetical protein